MNLTTGRRSPCRPQADPKPGRRVSVGASTRAGETWTPWGSPDTPKSRIPRGLLPGMCAAEAACHALEDLVLGRRGARRSGRRRFGMRLLGRQWRQRRRRNRRRRQSGRRNRRDGWCDRGRRWLRGWRRGLDGQRSASHGEAADQERRLHGEGEPHVRHLLRQVPRSERRDHREDVRRRHGPPAADARPIVAGHHPRVGAGARCVQRRRDELLRHDHDSAVPRRRAARVPAGRRGGHPELLAARQDVRAR